MIDSRGGRFCSNTTVTISVLFIFIRFESSDTSHFIFLFFSFSLLSHFSISLGTCQAVCCRVKSLYEFWSIKKCVSIQTQFVGQPVSQQVHLSQEFFHRLYSICICLYNINPYPTAFPYRNGMVLHFYQQQESSTTKTVHKVINKGLKAYV